MRKVLLVFFLVLFTYNAYAIGELYIVKPQDTLWDISKRFYKNPFLWGKIWHNNTYINNPNLIFPGEILKVGKNGLEIYHPKKKIKPYIVSNKNKISNKKYLIAIWFDGNKYYSACGKGYCIWNKKDFQLAKMSFDTYSNIEVAAGDTVYLHTNREKLPKELYVYREFRDFLDTSICSGEDSVFLPLGKIEVIKRMGNGIFEGKIVKAVTEISKDDVVSSVYPYETVENLKLARVGDVKVKQILVEQSELQSGLGFMFFFKASKDLPILAGKEVKLARINKGSPMPVTVAKGVVISQYKKYIGIYFSSVNGMEEVPDRTQEYVLR